jgi:hypothetical protein
MPPAFNLSQDQTLQFISLGCPKAADPCSTESSISRRCSSMSLESPQSHRSTHTSYLNSLLKISRQHPSAAKTDNSTAETPPVNPHHSASQPPPNTPKPAAHPQPHTHAVNTHNPHSHDHPQPNDAEREIPMVDWRRYACPSSPVADASLSTTSDSRSSVR